MELHSNHKAYGCDLCNVRCRQYAGLYIHYKGVHKLKLRKHNVRYYRSEDNDNYTSLDKSTDVLPILQDGANLDSDSLEHT